MARLCAHPVEELLDAARVGPGVQLLDVGTGPGTVAAAQTQALAMVVQI